MDGIAAREPSGRCAGARSGFGKPRVFNGMPRLAADQAVIFRGVFDPFLSGMVRDSPQWLNAGPAGCRPHSVSLAGGRVGAQALGVAYANRHDIGFNRPIPEIEARRSMPGGTHERQGGKPKRPPRRRGQRHVPRIEEPCHICRLGAASALGGNGASGMVGCDASVG